MSVAHIPATHARRLGVGSLLAAVLVLVAALVALATWTVADRSGSSSTTGLASPEVAAMLRDRIAALNTGDAATIAAFYATDALLEERDVTPAVVTRGNEQIGETGYPDEGFVLVYALDARGKIEHQWVLPAR